MKGGTPEKPETFPVLATPPVAPEMPKGLSDRCLYVAPCP